MNPDRDVADEVLELARSVETRLGSSPLAQEARKVRDRLEGPLRIAIAGRVKAGKSTTLNALLGERLAPTDAGECTKVVTWYVQGAGSQVMAEPDTGVRFSVPFRLEDGRLVLELGATSAASLRSLEVSWPSRALSQITLIDTPGLGSIDAASSRRTQDFLDQNDGEASDADAVIYLMRHAHQTDSEFLASFMDGEVLAASPVNSVALLSRADEIGAGRLDALESAARIAGRYRHHDLIRSLTAEVLPFSGLLAETGLTLREDEAGALISLARMDEAEVDWMLLSADQFCDIEKSDLTVEARRALLGRFGMYGLRFAIAEVRAGRAATASELSRVLVQRSGLAAVRELIESDFVPRARILHTSSALATLRRLADRIDDVDPALADDVLRAVERILAGAIELVQIRAAHLALGGVVKLPESARAEVAQVVHPEGRSKLLGLSPGASAADRRSAALTALAGWRTRAADPLASPLLIEVCDAMARTYEQMVTETVDA